MQVLPSLLLEAELILAAGDLSPGGALPMMVGAPTSRLKDPSTKRFSASPPLRVFLLLLLRIFPTHLWLGAKRWQMPPLPNCNRHHPSLWNSQLLLIRQWWQTVTYSLHCATASSEVLRDYHCLQNIVGIFKVDLCNTFFPWTPPPPQYINEERGRAPRENCV